MFVGDILNENPTIDGGCTGMYHSDQVLTDDDRSHEINYRQIQPNAKNSWENTFSRFDESLYTYIKCVFGHSKRDFMFIPKSIWFNNIHMFYFIWELFLNTRSN